MASITLTVTQDYEVPDGTTAVYSEVTGVLVGLRLPDGAFIKPWIIMERYAPGGENDDPIGDASEDALNEIGVFHGVTCEREIEVSRGTINFDPAVAS